MKKFVPLLFILLFDVFSAQKREIMAVLTAQQTAWNQEFMYGYWQNDSLVFIGSKGPTFGWKKTLENYKKSYPTSEKMGTLVFSDLSVKMLGKKHALVMGKWKLIRPNDTPNGIYTLIFRKFKNGWKIISDHTH